MPRRKVYILRDRDRRIRNNESLDKILARTPSGFIIDWKFEDDKPSSFKVSCIKKYKRQINKTFVC